MADLQRTLESEIKEVVREEVDGLMQQVSELREEVKKLERGEIPPRRRGGRKKPVAPKTLSPEAIRANRDRLNLTQADLAALVGVTPVAVYFWESGRTVPVGGNAERLLELRKIGVREAARRVEKTYS